MKNLHIFLVFLLIGSLFSFSVLGQNCNLNASVSTVKGSGFTEMLPTNTDGFRIEVCKGTKTAFFIDSSQTQFGYAYQWRKVDGTGYPQDIKGATSPKLILSQVSETGRYSCTFIKNNCPTRESQVFNFIAQESVFAEIVPLRQKNEDGSYSICSGGGDLMYLNSSVKFDSYNYGETFQWLKDGKEITGQNKFYLETDQPGSYTFSYKQGNCDVVTAPVKLVGTTQMTSFLYNSSNLSLQKSDIRDSVYLCTGMKTTLNPFERTDRYNNIVWTKNGTFYSSGDRVAIYTGEAGTYQATYNRGNCEVKTSKTKVIVGNKVELDSLRAIETNNLFACNGGATIALVTNLKRASYNFATNATVNFISLNASYTQQVSNNYLFVHYTKLNETFVAKYQNGDCAGTSPSLKLNANNFKFKAKIIRTETGSTCGKSSVLLQFSANLQGIPMQWYRDGVAIEGATDYKFSTNIAGKYWSKVKQSGVDCINYSDTVTVTLPQNTFIPPNISIDKTNCKDGIYTISTPKVAGYTYQWKKDGQFLSGETQSVVSVSVSGKYKLAISDGKCSYESNEIEVGGKIIFPTTQCLNQPFQLSYSGIGKSYEWVGSSGYKSSEAAPKFSSVNYYGGLFKVKVTDNNGCANYATGFYYPSQPANINLRLNTPRVVSEGSDSYFSFYGNFDYYSNIQNTKLIVPYQKEPIYNLTTINIKNVQIATHTGLYKVEVIKDGCTFKDSVNVYVVKKEDIPSISIKSSIKKTYCNFENIKIDYQVKGFLPPKTGLKVYFVNLDNNTSYSDNAYYTQNPITTQVPYSLYGKNFAVYLIEPTPFYTDGNLTNLLITPNSTPFEIKPQPRYIYFQNVDNQYSSNSVCKGSKVNFLADTSNYSIAYQWQFNKKDIPSATTRKLVAADSGLYSLNYTIDGCLVENSSSYLLNTGKTIQPPIFKSNSITQVCDGFTVPLSVYDPGPQFQLQWKKDGVAILNATGLDYRATQTGNYTVESTAEGGCKATSTVQSVLIGSPTVSLNYEGLQELCGNLYAYGYIGGTSNSTDLLKVLDFRFQWLKDGKEINRANDVGFNMTESGTYQLRVEQGKCTVLSKVLTLKKTNIVRAKLTNNNIGSMACGGNNMFLNMVFPQNFYANQATYYRDGNIISQGSTYYSPTQNGKYWAVASDYTGNCRANSDTLTLNFESNKTNYVMSSLQSDLPTNLCNKDTITLSTTAAPDYSLYNSTAVFYQWYKEGKAYTKTIINTLKTTEEGNYSVEVNHPDGCKSVYPPLQIKKSEALPISISHSFPSNSIADLKLCSNSQVPLMAGNYYYPSGLTPTYQWQKDNKDIVGANSANLLIGNAGTYLLKTSLGKCTGTSNPITITEVQPINVSITPKDSVTLCPTGKIDLKIPADKDLTYSWRKDGLELINTNSNILNVGEQAKYWVVARRQDCFKQSNAVQVFVRNIPPTATLTGDKQINYGDSTALKVEFTSAPPWTFKFSDDTNKVITASISPYLRYVKTLGDKTFTLNSVKNLCGVGKIAGSAKITVLILGTEELNDGIKINLYPMPTVSRLNLLVESPEAQTLQWQLTDIQGRILTISEKENKKNRHEQSISVANLPTGMYLFKVEIGEKIIYRKIIKE